MPKPGWIGYLRGGVITRRNRRLMHERSGERSRHFPAGNRIEPLEGRVLLSATAGAGATSSKSIKASAVAGDPVATPAVVSSMTINLTFDSTVTALANASEFESACTYSAQQIEDLYNDPITINIKVVATPGTSTLGESSTRINSKGYTAIRNALIADEKTSDDQTAMADDWPVASPLPAGASLLVSSAEQKAIGLFTGTATSSDGTFTFGTGFNYTLDPNNRAVAGKIDFFGVAEHEMTEIMGRIDGLSTTSGFEAMDLFRFTAANVHSLSPTDTGVYFSVDGGTTNLKNYNPNNGGDLGDWASGANDSFNAFSSSSVENNITAVDKRVMDVLGYDFHPSSTITGTAGVDQITLKRDPDNLHIDWTLGTYSAAILINDAGGLTINGLGGNDVITLDTSNGNPLPNLLHLNGNFSINGLAGANPLAGTTMEIGQSTVYFNYAGGDSPVASIQQALANGYNGGAWNGVATASVGAITSTIAASGAANSFGLGFADAADGVVVGQPVNTVEVTYTVMGDANLDRVVNFSDALLLQKNWTASGTPGWDIGNFNYDAVIDGSDAVTLGRNYNNSANGSVTPAATLAVASNIGSSIATDDIDTGPLTDTSTILRGKGKARIVIDRIGAGR